MSNKAQRLRILHVIPSIAPCRGGPSKAVIEMVSALRRINIDAEIATTNDNGPSELDLELNQLVEYQGVPTRFFQRYSPNINAVREFAYSASFRTWLNEHIHDYHLVHVHAIFSYCSSIAMLIARRHDVPYIVRPIGQLEDWSLAQSALKKRIYLAVLEKSNIEAANAVHFTAGSEQEQALSRFHAIKSAVIPLGIEPPKLIKAAEQAAFEYWQIEPEIPCLVFLSRLHPKKGLEILLEAVAQIKHKSWKLMVAGDGDKDYLEQLINRSRELGIAERVSFIGFVDGDEKNTLLQRADLFCLTSYSENFGVAVLEAMASGTAPLVSKEVALTTDIKEHALGFVCDLNVDDISTKLLSALSDLEGTRQLGNTARNFVGRHFQWSNIALQLSELYITHTA